MFSELTIVDEVFNGRLLRKIDRYKSISKEYGIFYAIVGIGIAILMLIIMIGGSKNPNFYGSGIEKIIGMSFFTLMLCFGLFAAISGINHIKTSFNITNDYKYKRIKKIKETPKKVRLIYESSGRTSTIKYICAIKVYFSKVILIIPFEYIESKKTKAKIKTFKKICLEINSEITYLEKSKIVIKGYDKYLRYARQYVLEWK